MEQKKYQPKIITNFDDFDGVFCVKLSFLLELDKVKEDAEKNSACVYVFMYVYKCV